jgi:hypothetical protein
VSRCGLLFEPHAEHSLVFYCSWRCFSLRLLHSNVKRVWNQLKLKCVGCERAAAAAADAQWTKKSFEDWELRCDELATGKTKKNKRAGALLCSFLSSKV